MHYNSLFFCCLLRKFYVTNCCQICTCLIVEVNKRNTKYSLIQNVAYLTIWQHFVYSKSTKSPVNYIFLLFLGLEIITLNCVSCAQATIKSNKLRTSYLLLFSRTLSMEYQLILRVINFIFSYCPSVSSHFREVVGQKETSPLQLSCVVSKGSERGKSLI